VKGVEPYVENINLEMVEFNKYFSELEKLSANFNGYLVAEDLARVKSFVQSKKELYENLIVSLYQKDKKNFLDEFYKLNQQFNYWFVVSKIILETSITNLEKRIKNSDLENKSKNEQASLFGASFSENFSNTYNTDNFFADFFIKFNSNTNSKPKEK